MSTVPGVVGGQEGFRFALGLLGGEGGFPLLIPGALGESLDTTPLLASTMKVRLQAPSSAERLYRSVQVTESSSPSLPSQML